MTTPREEMGAKILAELRAEGYKVKVRHHRERQHSAVIAQLANRVGEAEAAKLLKEIAAQLPLEPNGGSTIVTVCDKEDVTLAVGYSNCRSDERFDRRLGLTIAAGRARKKLHALIPF